MKKIYLITFLFLIFTTKTFAIDPNITPLITNSAMKYQDYDNFIISIDLLGFQTYNFESLEETRTTIFKTMGSPDEPFVLQDFSVSLGINTSKLIKNTSIGVIIGSKSMTFTEHTTETEIFDIPIYFSDNEGYSTFLESELNNLEVITQPSTSEVAAEGLQEFEVNMRFIWNSEIYGFNVNYQLVEPFTTFNIFQWNGISLGSGFILNKRSTESYLDLSSALGLPDGSLDINLLVISSAKTVPLEVTTGIKLFSMLTITSGIAIDIQMSSLGYSSGNSDSNDSLGAKMVNKIVENIYADMDELSFKPRFNIGAGIGFGPVLCDISLSYYLDSGITFGSNVVVRF